MSRHLEIERRGRVAVMTISHPEARNSLGPEIYEAGGRLLEQAAEDGGTGALVLTGAGATFSAGGDLKRLRANRAAPASVQRDSVEQLHRWIRALRSCPKPILCAVEGVAAGAGFSLALACDLIVAAEDASFVMAYVRIGLSPDSGATAFLARGLPPQLTAELLFDGGRVSARRLHDLGVVNRLTAPGASLAEAVAWAERLAAGPGVALGRSKALIEAAYGEALARQLDREAEQLTAALHHREAGEGIAAFLEKRPPDYRRV